MSNKWKVIVCIMTTILVSLSLSIVKANEVTSSSSLTINYSDINNLNDDEKKKIIYKSPGEYTTHYRDDFKLIYSEKEKLNSPSIKKDNDKKNVLAFEKENKLPNTSENSSDVYTLMGLILLFILLLICYILHKNKKSRSSVLLLLLSFGCFSPLMADASTLSYLLPTVKRSVVLNQVNSIDTPTINGYDYVGYIYEYESQENHIAEQFGIVTVRYVNTLGEDISEPLTLKGKVASPYSTEARIIEGYTLKTTPENFIGNFRNDQQQVNYVYEKDIVGELLIKHIDEDGNEISSTSEKYGKIGDSYEEFPKEIEGYTIKVIPDNAKGQYTKGKQFITFVYKKASEDAKIIIKFVDYDGNPFTMPVFTDYDMIQNDSQLENIEDDISNYYGQLQYNGSIFNQKSKIEDIVLQGKIGDKYDLPDELFIDVMNPLGKKVILFNSKLYEYFQGIEGYSNDSSGIIQSELTIVTYIMTPVIFGLA